MKRNLTFLALLSFLSLPALAQSTAVGFQLGVSQSNDNGIDFDFGGDLKEVFFSLDTDASTTLKLKAGRMESDEPPDIEGLILTDGTVEYLALVAEYRFYEVFGSTSLFAGPAAYRQEYGTLDETNFGITAGVNGLFPVTRRFGVTAELAYHWANFEETRSFVTAAAGVRIGF